MEFRTSAVRHVTDDREIKSFALLVFDRTSRVAASVSVRVKIRSKKSRGPYDPDETVYFIIIY